MPLKIGDSIFSKRAISISLGASWTYGLYYDWDAQVWYVTEKCKILEVFGDAPAERKQAFGEYYRLCGGRIMKEGDLVTIFEDPLTKQKAEGEALLIKQVMDDRFQELWLVSFQADQRKCYRWIKK